MRQINTTVLSLVLSTSMGLACLGQNNIVPNPGFETPNSVLPPPTYPTSFTGIGSAPSSAAEWVIGNNANTTTFTELLPSTDPFFGQPGGGGNMIHVITGAAASGLAVQMPHLGCGSGYVDVFVNYVAGLGNRVYYAAVTADGGALVGPPTYSQHTGQWERLFLPEQCASDPANHPISSVNIYADTGGADFYVDSAYYAPEGSSLAMLLAPTPIAVVFWLGRRRMRTQKA